MTFFNLYQNFLINYNRNDNPNKTADFYNLLFHYSKKVKSTADFFFYKNSEIDFSNKLDDFKTDLYLIGKFNFPVAYIVKHKYFYGKKFYVRKGALIPRPETELLVDKIIMQNYTSNLKILDLCSGVGVIGLTLAVALKANVTLVEKERIPYLASIKNKWFHQIKNARILNTSAEKFVRYTRKKFDIIVMNPPYIDWTSNDIDKNVRNYEPKEALFCKNNGYYFYHLLFQ